MQCFRVFFLLAVFCIFSVIPVCAGEDRQSFITAQDRYDTVDRLLELNGNRDRSRMSAGVEQASRFWRPEDGDKEAFKKFCCEHYIADRQVLAAFAAAMERNLELIEGSFYQIRRSLKRPLDVDTGAIFPFDRLLASYDPHAGLGEAFFRTKIAFAVLLNFPLLSSEDVSKKNFPWSRELTREDWARFRLAQRFASRVSPEARMHFSEVSDASRNYIYSGKIPVTRIVNEALKPVDEREGFTLLPHWEVRDEIRSLYGGGPAAQEKQQALYRVMERVACGEVPAEASGGREVLWEPSSNRLYTKNGQEISPQSAAENRYDHLQRLFRAELLIDACYPEGTTVFERVFDQEMEMSRKKVEKMLITVLEAPEAKDTAALIRRRLGRPLRPYDIWYQNFGENERPADKLDMLLREKYPNPEALQADLPRILMKLGFSRKKAEFLAEHIVIEASRGSGHASGPQWRYDKAYLRIPFTAGGLNYDGYGTAMHELGHGVEQVFSLYEMDHTLLAGVPNTAFTEAFAFLFEDRHMDILGIPAYEEQPADRAALSTFWNTWEIAGVSLHSIRLWQWMYDNPGASSAEIGVASVKIAKEIWNTYYAPVMGVEDSPVLACYSHMIYRVLYLPNYPVGHIIHYQIHEYMKDKNLSSEMERMCSLGRLTPDVWMEKAVGASVSAEPLLRAARAQLDALEEK